MQPHDSMAAASQPNPFDEPCHRDNLSFPQFANIDSGASSANASLAANDSSASLLDPMLDSGSKRLPYRLEEQATTTHHQEQSQMRKAGQKPTKSVAPIRIPRKSETSQHQQTDGLRSPANALSSAALARSFPMPPARTPASSSPAGTFGSPAVSAHGHSHHASTPSASGTRSNSPQDSSSNPSPVLNKLIAQPRKLLSVPPPTPAFSNSRASTSLDLYWEGEASSIRNSGSHPLPTSVMPYYSADPAAYVHTPVEEEPYTRIKSFAAEYSTPVDSGSVSPSFPPRAYSPAGSSDISRSSRLPAELPMRGDHTSPRKSHGNRNVRPTLHRSQSDNSDDPQMLNKRRESSGTFGTVFSSAASVPFYRAINTLENEDFASSGTRTSTHTRTHSEVSVASSPGMTHELVRRGNVFEALLAGTQEASRRLARASLVSSELLRSASSIDALRNVLAEDPAYAVDKDYDPACAVEREYEYSRSGPMTGMRRSHRYSSGPAPTLASLAEDEDDLYLTPSDLDYIRVKQRKSRHRSGSKRPRDQVPRRNSDWANKSSKSYSSHRSGKSSANFTVASYAPSLPTLRNPSVRAEIAVKEATIPFTKLAKRASTLGAILDNMPEHAQYVGYHDEENGSHVNYDEIRELRYSNQLRKARRKVEMGIPNLWNSHTPIGSVSSAAQLRDSALYEKKQDTDSANNVHAVHPEGSLDERHFRRRKSYPASQLREAMSMRSEKPSSSGIHGRSSFSSSGSQTEEYQVTPPRKLSYWKALPPHQKKKFRLAVMLLIVLLIAAAVGIAIPLSERSTAAGAECERTCSGHGKPVLRDDECVCQCSGSRAGPFCDLDATCTCPDGSADCPNRLAKSLLNAASTASTLFAPPVNTTRLAAALAGSSNQANNDCSSQVRLLETPNLDPGQYKSRRRWIQAVLLWDAAISEDFTNEALPAFQAGLSYWQWQDSPSFQAQPAFQAESHGYSIDFAYQKVFVLPKTLPELGVSQASIARLDNTSATALQRVGAFALAASNQRSSALLSLFASLGYQAEQLSTFRTNILAFPVYFPFDLDRPVGSQSAMSVAFRQKDSDASFPIPAACIPGVSASQISEINRVEADIFGLPAAISASEVPTNCTGRPIYGILNILNLRLPFLDEQRPQQAVVMADQTRKSRLTFLAGPSLIPLSFSGNLNTSALTTASYGTVAAIDNVLFDYLAQLSDAAVARAFIEYVLSGERTPPSSVSQMGSLLSNGLRNMPIIEVQAWGGLSFSDIDYIVSSITRTGGDALFGSNAGAELRNWAHSGQNSKPIRWSLDATSQQYTLDGGNDTGFQSAWDSSGSLSPAAIADALGASDLLTS